MVGRFVGSELKQEAEAHEQLWNRRKRTSTSDNMQQQFHQSSSTSAAWPQQPLGASAARPHQPMGTSPAWSQQAGGMSRQTQAMSKVHSQEEGPMGCDRTTFISLAGGVFLLLLVVASRRGVDASRLADAPQPAVPQARVEPAVDLHGSFDKDNFGVFTSPFALEPAFPFATEKETADSELYRRQPRLEMSTKRRPSFDFYPSSREEKLDHLNMDFSLVGLSLVLLAFCLGPTLCSGWNSASPPWQAGAQGSPTTWPGQQPNQMQGTGGVFGAGAFGAAGSWPNQAPGQGPSYGYGAGMGQGSPGLAGSYGYGSGMGPGSSDNDVAETYSVFGVELQRVVQGILRYVHGQIIDSLLREIDESDRVWQQVLSERGWRLSLTPQRFPGTGAQMRELSVFDRCLPAQLSSGDGEADRRAGELWQRRQRLEACLVHPLFEPIEQRSYVLGRLREWHQRGNLNGALSVQQDWRRSDALPTDGHILENLLIKMLSCSLDFDNCFRAEGLQQPRSSHMGQPHVAFLRQVSNQQISPRPAPHYEVAMGGRTWRLRAGATNLIEALGLLLLALRAANSSSYAAFPAALQEAVEIAKSGAFTLPGLLSWLRYGLSGICPRRASFMSPTVVGGGSAWAPTPAPWAVGSSPCASSPLGANTWAAGGCGALAGGNTWAAGGCGPQMIPGGCGPQMAAAAPWHSR